MKSFRFFWILLTIAVALVASIFFSSKKIDQIKSSGETQKVVIPDITPMAEPSMASKPLTKILQEPGPTTKSGCVTQQEFKDLRQELGKIVNQQDLREHKTQEFLKLINEFRQKNGLPLPVLVSSNKLDSENTVYNNCRSTCGGSVHEVFVLGIVSARQIQVLTKEGNLKKLPLHESGLEMASIDELNRKGVPFRSWLAPVSENDWYVKDNNIYYSLDIEGLWLKIDSRSNWEVVAHPTGVTKLKLAEEPLKVPGCNNDEQCLEGAGRHFKAPRLCQK